MHPLDKYLDDLRQQASRALSNDARLMGQKFEDLCLHYLKHDAIQTAQYRNAQRYGQWAEERKLPETDTGIDLVAELKDKTGFVAIQCKFYHADADIPKSEIDSFLAASGGSEFRHRIIIYTNRHGWSRNADNTLRAQKIEVTRIGLHDLKASNIDWSAYIGSGTAKYTKKKQPRPHQEKAIGAAVQQLKDPDTRGKLFMACGTGKTLVALRIAESLAGKGGRVLVLVPSLALLSQTLRAWFDDAMMDLRPFVVCSENQKIQKHRGDTDMADMNSLDLSLPATTQARILANRAKTNDPQKLTVIFATYQSSQVIADAQRKYGLPEFSLAIADEAHRTAGALIPGEEPSAFVRIHDNAQIQTQRRLYMTATPKVYAPSAKKRAGEHATSLCSMDDETRYGPVIHETRFGDAVGKELLSDYKVIVLTVPESFAAETMRLRNFDDGEALTLDEEGKMIGALRALVKMDKKEFHESDRAPMRRAIAFCNLIKSSKRLEQHLGDIATIYAKKPGNAAARQSLKGISAQHVDGTFSATARAARLAFLENTPEGETHILTNARCLTEGVDVPALDGIVFMQPRKSQIEVVQAVGRVMRKVEGKKYGYIILPVVIPTAATPDEALKDNARWEAVWQMLNAIRSHDERFEGMINRFNLGEAGDKISIIQLADWYPPSEEEIEDDIDDSPASDPDDEREPEPKQLMLEGLPEAIRTRIVEKCGKRKYWEDWAGDVAKIASAHIERIRTIVNSGAAEQSVFETFLTELRDDLNPEVSQEDAIEMLAQHMITQPVFDALFGETATARHNTVSQGMQNVLDVLKPARIDTETENLDGFYTSVRNRVQAANTTSARQSIAIELYDKFFRTAFPDVTQKLGIAYTPVEVVDFILHSVQHLLTKEFNTTLGEDGVHILDPFTGTGTFLTRLMQSGLLTPEQIKRKYGRNGQTPELHANEMVLLAYYIASVNIETTFQDSTNENYKPFEGICLTDTFSLEEHDDKFAEIFPDNSQRRIRQKQLDVRVIIGNPPWSAGQRSSADNNPNTYYPRLAGRIKETFASRSKATNKNSLYDSYKMAIRWAADRIGDKGIIGFVTNGSFIDGNVDSGIRACLAEEFSSIHVLNLRGNARTQGKQRRREGDNIFDAGSRAPVAITLMVRNPDARHTGAKILYHDIGDYFKREQKLQKLQATGSIANITDWQTITPDTHHDWISQRSQAYQSFYPIGSERAKKGKSADAIFTLFSNGYQTKRDAYIYNFSRATCTANARNMVKNYSNALQEYQASQHKAQELDDIVAHNAKYLRWNRELKNNLQRQKKIAYAEDKIWAIQYRPFVKQHGYIEYVLAAHKFQQDCIFPRADSDNRVICVMGIGEKVPFSALVSAAMPDLHLLKACQCFPRYRFELDDAQKTSLLKTAEPLTRTDNITDTALINFRTQYSDKKIQKDDIFDYVYGLLHAPDFRKRFANDLSKGLPRIPFAPDFHAFAKAGRALASLHLEYETGKEYPLSVAQDAMQAKGSTAPPLFTTRKMRLTDKDKSTLIVNEHLRLGGIPPDAHRYQVNGRTPLDWFIDRYRITTDKQSGLTNDPNAWFPDTASFIAAVQRIVHLSVETMRIVDSLPPAFKES